MMRFHVDATITVWCEAIGPRCTFVARFHVDCEHYSGAGATAFEALAWCLDDYVRRGLLGHDPSPARNADAQPGDGLVLATSSRPRRITPAPITTGPTLAPTETGQCFEQQIPRAAAPRLHHETPATPTTPRRARGGRR